MLFVQHQEIKKGKIPALRPHNPMIPERGFLGIENYCTTSWGDLLALWLIDFAIGEEIAEGIPLTVLFISLIAGVVITMFCQREWMGSWHKPDWAYPRKGEISLAGKIHLGYFFAQLTIVIAGALFLVIGSLSLWQIAVAGIGGGLYVLAIFLDITSGRWAKTPPSAES